MNQWRLKMKSKHARVAAEVRKVLKKVHPNRKVLVKSENYGRSDAVRVIFLDGWIKGARDLLMHFERDHESPVENEVVTHLFLECYV
jgi:Ran GTPase-activating protein (RanGAP) involved in mRNA processing and transport